LKSTTGRLALLAAAGLFVGGMAVPSAKAADLGGDCCADLEERVAELEATTARKGNRKMSLTISGQVNRSMLYWNDGFAKDVYSVDNAVGNSRVRFLGSAKVNPAITAGFLLEFDLGIGARSHQVSQVDDDGFGGNTGGGLGTLANGDGLGAAGDGVTDIIHANWYLEHKDIGRLTVGRMSTTTAGISIIDLSNQVVAANAQSFLWGGSFLLRNGAGSLATASTWGSMTCGGAGAASGGPYAVDCGISALSRRDAIMYTTPTWGGFIAGVSFGENNFWDASLRYGGEYGGFRVAAGVGYRSYRDQEADVLVVGPPDSDLSNTDRRMTLASGSIMHVTSGLYVTGSWYKYEFRGTNLGEVIAAGAVNRPDTKNWYISGGIQQNWTGLGSTTFYGEYSKTTDGITGLCANNAGAAVGGCAAATALTLAGLGTTGLVVDSELRFWGLGVVQNVSSAAMDLYLGYRRYSVDATTNGAQATGGLEDIWYVQGGARIQF
jgi:hypothetical protein